MRFRGGSPKNMGQGQYWVRRNLDDQKRLAAAAKRAVAERERAAKAALKEIAQRDKARIVNSKRAAAADLQEARNRHFDYIQSQIAQAIEALGTVVEGDGHLRIPVEEGSKVHEDMKATTAAFNELAGQISEEELPLTAGRMAKHVSNARKMLVAFGRGMNIPTRWDADSKLLSFGERQIDFAGPT